MKGTEASPPVRALTTFDMTRKPGRSDFIPVRLVQKAACLWAERAGPDGSGRLAPLLRADGLAYIPADEIRVQAGHLVDVFAFDARDHSPLANWGSHDL